MNGVSVVYSRPFDNFTVYIRTYSMCFVLFRVALAGCCKYLLYQVCTCSTVLLYTLPPPYRLKKFTVERAVEQRE